MSFLCFNFLFTFDRVFVGSIKRTINPRYFPIYQFLRNVEILCFVVFSWFSKQCVSRSINYISINKWKSLVLVKRTGLWWCSSCSATICCFLFLLRFLGWNTADTITTCERKITIFGLNHLVIEVGTWLTPDEFEWTN